MKKIAFVANYNKTIFFEHVSQHLENVEVYWICISKFWLDHLFANGVESARILYLPRNVALNNCEVIGDLRLNELIYSDRVLRFEVEFGQKYLESVQRPFFDFVKDNELSFIFGELTWAHEVLFQRICNQYPELNCSYLKPHTIRIPSKRFAFFADEFEENLYEVKNRAIPDDYAKFFKVEKPDYYHINNAKNSIKSRFQSIPYKVRLFFSREKNDKSDPTQTSLRGRYLWSKVGEEINLLVYKFFIKRLKYHELPGSYWVYFLHKQPEASIDILGRYYEDQLKNILYLARKMPDECQLLVKEHGNAIGDRSFRYYKKICAINRVLLVDETIDSYKLLEDAQMTCTVSGTVAYEAGLLGKNAMTFSKVFFSELPSILSLVKPGKKKCVSNSEFKKKIYAASFDGIISDPKSDPRCIELENLKKVSAAFNSVIGNC